MMDVKYDKKDSAASRAVHLVPKNMVVRFSKVYFWDVLLPFRARVPEKYSKYQTLITQSSKNLWRVNVHVMVECHAKFQHNLKTMAF